MFNTKCMTMEIAETQVKEILLVVIAIFCSLFVFIKFCPAASVYLTPSRHRPEGSA